MQRRKGRDSIRGEGGKKTGGGTEQRRTNSVASAQLDNEEKEPQSWKRNEKREDALLLHFSSAVSLLASALVDHGRKQVAASALLLWALVAERYNSMIQWFYDMRLELSCRKSL